MKTIIWLNDKNNYVFKYNIIDDDGNLVDEGYRFYDSFKDDLVVSESEGVYIDSVGSYILDDDGNKVYHLIEVINRNIEKFTDNDYLMITFVENNELRNLNVNLTDLTKDGKYVYDSDYITFEVDVLNESISYLTKDSLSTVDVIFYSEPIRDILKTIEDFDDHNIQKQVFEDIETVKDLIATESSSLKDDINSTISLSKDNIISEIANSTNDVKLYIDTIYNRLIVDVVDIENNFGSKFKHGDIVVIKGFSDKWFIDKTFVYTNDRGAIKIACILKEDLEDKDSSIQIIDQDLLSKI